MLKLTELITIAKQVDAHNRAKTRDEDPFVNDGRLDELQLASKKEDLVRFAIDTLLKADEAANAVAEAGEFCG